MNIYKGISGAVWLSAIILGGQAAFASDLPIVNPSFESPSTTLSFGGAGSGAIPGWTISGSGLAGVWSTVGAPIGPAPDGTQIGFINGYGSTTTVSQTLTSDLQPNTTYTLNIDVGGRTDGFNPGTDYAVGLYAGSSLLTSVTPETPESGAWTLLTATYTTGSSVTPDEALSISISTPETQLDFDNVVLDPETGDDVGTVPDGGVTAMLLGVSMAGLGWLRRKI